MGTQPELIPALKQAGVKVCADTELGCFRLGRPLVTEMQRAVEHSHYSGIFAGLFWTVVF